MGCLVKNAEPGDQLLFSCKFSLPSERIVTDVNDLVFGHGRHIRDRHGTEEDGLDEVILPLDFEEAGYITDDVSFAFLNFIVS